MLIIIILYLLNKNPFEVGILGTLACTVCGVVEFLRRRWWCLSGVCRVSLALPSVFGSRVFGRGSRGFRAGRALIGCWVG